MASSLMPVLGVTTLATDTPPAPVTDGEQSGLPHALAAVPDPRDPRGIRYRSGKAGGPQAACPIATGGELWTAMLARGSRFR